MAPRTAAKREPSNDRPWKPDFAQTAHGTLNGEQLTLHNIRNTRYGAPGTPYDTVWDTRRYDLSRLRRVWFIVEPFRPSLPVVAHNLLSFEFAEDFLAFSAEARLERGESYSILRGMRGGFELAYTFGDERDFIARRTNYLDHHLYLYPLRVLPEAARALLLRLVATANDLTTQPRFYHSAFENCTSVLAKHANEVCPGAFPPFLIAQVMPGRSDKVLYDKGWLDTHLPWDEVRAAFDVKARANAAGNALEFSRVIRESIGAMGTG